MIQIMTRTNNNIIARVPMRSITDEARSAAKKQYTAAVEHGSAISGYDDPVWIMTDQKRQYRICFNHRDTEVASCCHELGITYDTFIADLKTFAALRLGTCGLCDLRNLVRFIVEEFVRSRGFRLSSGPGITSSESILMYHMDFVVMMPFTDTGYRKACENTMNLIKQKNADSRKDRDHACTMNEFQSYFRFDDILNLFWQTASDEQKTVYYPLYLFWRITTVLPLRVVEFCVLPFDCIEEKSGLYYLTIRRSRLKGNSSIRMKIHDYTIEGDYNRYTYQLSKSHYTAISEYIELTKDYPHPFGLLFSLDYIASHSRGLILPSETHVFGTGELGVIIREFYREVVIGEYGYTLISEDDLMARYMDEKDGSYEMRDKEIMLIKAKHTRHLALINLILRGCSPMLIREFAGHADDAMSSHYYSNISKTIRCGTKQLYHRYRNRLSEDRGYVQFGTQRNPLSMLLDAGRDPIRVDHGWCYSEALANNNESDCQKVGGNCELCEKLDPDKQPLSDSQPLEDELEYIVKMLRNPNTEQYLEEFQVRAQQLESHIANYAEMVWKEFMKEDGEKAEIYNE